MEEKHLITCQCWTCHPENIGHTFNVVMRESDLETFDKFVKENS